VKESESDLFKKLFDLNDSALKGTKVLMLLMSIIFLCGAIGTPILLLYYIGIVPVLLTIVTGLLMKMFADMAHHASNYIVYIRHIEKLRNDK
jgi:nucleoside permease NupC